jgi:dTDP-4-dehydrorhamnose 3,5-epimerase
MIVSSTAISGLLVIEPTVFTDERGYFFEPFNEALFKAETGLKIKFVQDNESRSVKHALRGLHFQVPPHAQAKLVRVVKGAVLDIAVDLRVGSPTFGQHASIILSEENKLQFFIPEGFAHGFLVLEPNTVFSYKCSAPYNKEAEMALRWDDADLGIQWGIDGPILSDKDAAAPLFKDFNSPFEFAEEKA